MRGCMYFMKAEDAVDLLKWRIKLDLLSYIGVFNINFEFIKKVGKIQMKKTRVN